MFYQKIKKMRSNFMNKKNILIIDDEQPILDLLKVFVEDNGYNAKTAASAEKGLAMIHNSQFDMLLLDIHLPDGNGLSILQKVHPLYPQLPIIMITGNDDIEIAEECLKHGAVDYIAKPFDCEYLKTSILVNLLGY
jgi:DNA-binding NtrC family response regulator